MATHDHAHVTEVRAHYDSAQFARLTAAYRAGELGEISVEPEPPLADDDDPVRRPCDLSQEMARDDDGAPLVGRRPQEGKVRVGIIAEHARRHPPSIRERQARFALALHDMAVRHDEPIGRDHHAGADTGWTPVGMRFDAHHGRPDLIDDAGHGIGIGVEEDAVG